MSKFLDLEGLGYYTQCFKPGLVELLDGGAKNLWDFKNAIYSGKSADASYTKTDTDITVTSNGAWSAVTYKVNGLITGQRYVWSVRISDYSVQSDTCRLRISSDVATQSSVANKTIEGNGNVYVEFVGQPELYFSYYINFSATSYQNTYKASENMICTKAEWNISQTYQPYRPPYQELYEQTETNENNISLLEQMNGKKNRFYTNLDIIKSANSSATWTGNSTTINGVTYTVNNDMTITVSSSGTNTQSIFYLNTITTAISVTPDDIISASLKNSGASSTTFEFRIYNGGVNIGADTGAGWSPSSSMNVTLGILIRASQTVSITFKPMICTKALYTVSPTYQPYAMSNVGLTNNILTGLSGCRFLADINNKDNYTFTFTKRNATTTRYRFGLMIAGVSAAGTSLFTIFADTNNDVTINNIAGTTSRSFTGTISYSGDNCTLTITPNDTQYGGIRVIWFD